MRVAHIPILLVLVAGCNPYTSRDGEFIAGAVDPASFPPAYLGAGGDRTRPGRGTFAAAKAYANGKAVGYYAFPFSTAQLGPPAPPPMNDPLKLLDGDNANPKVPAPGVYSFQPAPPCRAPAGYTYDPQRDEVRLDTQGAVFTTLPTANYVAGAAPTWSYVPVVSEVQVSGASDCQALKSEAAINARNDLAFNATGSFLAWAIIDVAAPVYKLGENPAMSSGVGVQKLGWYNHYITAYLDGGTIPTTLGADAATRMKPQNLYIPKQVLGANMMPGFGTPGMGYDVIDAARGDAAYSPVCAVQVYDTGAPLTPDQLPHDVATIQGMYAGKIKQSTFTPYLFCLQVAP